MATLKLPTKTISQIDRRMRDFWWGNLGEKSKLHTIKWSEICKPISEGGFGIIDSKCNNMALLATTCWTYIHDEKLLCSKILKANYCPNNPLWEAFVS